MLCLQLYPRPSRLRDTRAAVAGKGTLRNYDGGGNGNVKRAIGLTSKTTLHVHHAFCKFRCRLCTTTTWNDKILSVLEDGNGKTMNSAISVWPRARSSLLSSNLNSLLLKNRTTWNNREIVWKDEKCIFQRHFHGRSPLLDRKVPKMTCCTREPEMSSKLYHSIDRWQTFRRGFRTNFATAQHLSWPKC